MGIVQWVNLEKDDAYAADSDVGSKDRCGKLKFATQYDKNGVPITYTVKVSPAPSGNVVYTAAEQIRNPKFKLMKGFSDLATETEVALDDAIQLPAAGGNKYTLEAKDANGVKVASLEVEVRRKLYYQIIAMNDASGTVPYYALSAMEAHANQYFITLQKKGIYTTIPYRKTLAMHAGGNLTGFGSEVDAAFNIAPPFKKVGFAAVFSNYIASMKESKFTLPVVIGTSVTGVAAADVTVVGTSFLWHGMDDAEDAAKKWLVDAAAEYSDPATGAAQTYFIPRANINITGTQRFTYGGFYQVKITRDAGLDALLNKPQGIVTISVLVNIVDGWTNGFSWNPNGNPLITCAMRVLWRDMPINTREYTWNHEVGHRFGMVAYGNKTAIPGHGDLPDGPATIYGEDRGVNDKEHQGPHCESGVVYSPTAGWSGTPGCVMFGADGTATAQAPSDYCGLCKPIVRKLDLS